MQLRVKTTITKRAGIWSSCYNIILELQVLIEYGIIELDLAIESASNPFPVSSRI